MKYAFRIAALSCFLVFTAAAAAESPMYPLPPRAREPEHHAIQPGVYEQDSFWVEQAYPSTSVVDHYQKVFAGWLTCSRSDTGWVSYLDARGGERELVHELTRFWINRANDTAITLILRYQSPDSLSATGPNNKQQVVYLLRNRVSDARKAQGELDTTCETGV
jgi:hypothetical protein